MILEVSIFPLHLVLFLAKLNTILYKIIRVHRMNALHRKILRSALCLLTVTAIPAPAGHRFAPAYCGTYIRTTDGDRVRLHSPALHYTGDFGVGGYRCYISASLLMPRWADQNHHSINMPYYYDHYFGEDLFIGLSKQVEIHDGFTFIPAAGWHQNGIRLRGNADTLDFYSLTSGFGLQLMTYYDRSGRLPNYLVISCGWDFVDFLYEKNKLKQGFTLLTGLGYSF